jgi:hypothetical protein
MNENEKGFNFLEINTKVSFLFLPIEALQKYKLEILV